MLFLLFLATFSAVFGQYYGPIMYGLDPMLMANEINYMHQKIMERTAVIQRQIQAQSQVKMGNIPADGKVHSYEKTIPGGKTSGSMYHNKGPNHEEFNESHYTSQSFGQPESYLFGPRIPSTRVIETSFSSPSMDSAPSTVYNSKIPGYIYDDGPAFPQFAGADPSFSDYTKVIPITTSFVPAQTRVRAALPLAEKESIRDTSRSSSYAAQIRKLETSRLPTIENVAVVNW